LPSHAPLNFILRRRSEPSAPMTFHLIRHLLLAVIVVALASASIANSEVTGAVEPQVITNGAPAAPDLNALVLAAIRTMPVGGRYSVASGANRVLQAAVNVTSGGLAIDTSRAYPSYCSGATYLVFLRAVQHLVGSGSVSLDWATLAALGVRGQRDGVGIWGRWNANGPGTARLFHELDLGRNLTDYEQARAGDFMKILWTPHIGKDERGHSVIYLGRHMVAGVEHVRFWSSNQPFGYGEKSVPRTDIAHAIFSRFERSGNLARIKSVPERDEYLSRLLVVRSPLTEVWAMCGL